MNGTEGSRHQQHDWNSIGFGEVVGAVLLDSLYDALRDSHRDCFRGKKHKTQKEKRKEKKLVNIKGEVQSNTQKKENQHNRNQQLFENKNKNKGLLDLVPGDAWRRAEMSVIAVGDFM